MIIEESNKEYIKNIVDYLYTTNKRFTEEDLSLLFNKIFPDLEKLNFNLLDLTQFNSNVMNNNYEKIVDLFIAKKEMIINPDNDYIYTKVDSLLEFIYDYTNEHYNSSNREEFYEQLNDYEYTAVVLYDFDYYLKDDRIIDLYKSFEDKDLNYINFFIKEKCGDYKYKEELLNIIDDIKNVKESIKKLDPADYWYEPDYETRLYSLEDINYDYSRDRDLFIKYVEDYLSKNITDEYLALIKNIEIPNINI